VPFSQSQADAACNFFEHILKHTADEWFGKAFLLVPWQEQALSTIFGELDQAGNRVIEMAYLEVPKKAGKSEMAAGLALFVLLTTSTPGCQVYGAAAATRKALNVFRAACKMVDQSPVLTKRLRVLRGTHRIIKRSDPESFYAAVAADGDFGDGVNPAVVIADEIHRWKTRKQLDNWDVLSNGGITRCKAGYPTKEAASKAVRLAIEEYEAKTGRITREPHERGRRVWSYWLDGVCKSGFESAAQAEGALREAIARRDAEGRKQAQDAADRPGPPFAQFFENWLKEHASRRCAPKTLERYGELGVYLIRELGRVRLNDLTTAQIQTSIHHLQDHGGRRTESEPEGRPLAAKTSGTWARSCTRSSPMRIDWEC